MIDKKQEGRKRRGGWLSRFAPLLFLPTVFHGVFCPCREEPFVLTKPEVPYSGSGRFEGYTFKRIKKVGNFFAYGWVKTNRRVLAHE